MTALYSTLTPASKLALDAYNAAQYVYESSREEEHRVAMECAREVLLRELRSDFMHATMESDEAATGADHDA